MDNIEKYHKTYEDNKNLYLGKAYKVFESDPFKVKDPNKKDETYLQKNYFKIITDTFTNLSIYEPPIITLKKEQIKFDEFRKNRNLDFLIKRAFQLGSMVGDCIMVLDFDFIESPSGVIENESNFKLKIIPNDLWTPVIDQYSREEATVNYLSYAYDIKNENDKSEKYTVEKYFDYNEEENSTTIYFKVKKDGEEVEAPQEIIEKFKIEELSRTFNLKLFYRFINEESFDSYFGLGDYTDNVKALIREINNKLELEAVVDRKTSDPNLIVPDSYFQGTTKKASEIIKSVKDIGDNQTNNYLSRLSSIESLETQGVITQDYSSYLAKKLLNDGLKFLPVNERDGVKPEYVESQNTIERIETSIKRLKEELVEDTSLPKALLDSEFKIGQLSGSAIQKSIQPTLFKKKARELNMIIFLQEIILNIFKEEPTIVFQDGITDDPKEKSDLVVSKYKNGLLSQLEAIKRANNFTDEEALEMYNQIQEEKKANETINPVDNNE